MAIVSPRQVTSGYFRNHLYVTLGLTSLAALLSRACERQTAFWPALVAAAAELRRARCAGCTRSRAVGVVALVVAAWPQRCGGALRSATRATRRCTQAQRLPSCSSDCCRHAFNVVTSGLLLGIDDGGDAAGPLVSQRAGDGARAAAAAARRDGAWRWRCTRRCAALGLCAGSYAARELVDAVVAVRRCCAGRSAWSASSILIWMAWQTLEIPNTQSATGILYVAVIGVFVGETMSLLLSAE